jgi:hypothetical protein
MFTSKFIQIYLDPLLEAAFVGSMIYGIFAARAARGTQGGSFDAAGVLVTRAATATLLLLSALVVAYLFAPAYLDHVEAESASLAWLGLHGLPLYPPLDGQHDLYGTVYGPLLFELNALPLLLVPSIQASKFAGVAAFFLGLAFTYAALARSRNPALFRPLFLLAALFAFHSDLVFTNRAEPFLFAIGAAAAWLRPDHALSRGDCIRSALTLGLLAGFASALKLHGFLYVVPAASALLASERGGRSSLVVLVTGCIGAAAGFLMPFAYPAASLPGFIAYNTMTLHHAFSLKLLFLNGLLALSLAAGGLLLQRRSRQVPGGADRVFCVALAVAFALVALLASKTGAGAHHLLPFIPSLFVAYGLLLAGGKIGEPSPVGAAARAARAAAAGAGPGAARWLLGAGLCTFGVIAVHQGSAVASLWVDAARDRERAAELLELSARFPAAVVGVTDNDNYASSLLYPLIVFRQSGLRFDTAAWMDMQFAGVREEAVLDLLKGCRVPAWILPRDGAPFSMPSWYSRGPLFSQDFSGTFLADYRLTDRREFYSVWTCRATA